MPESRPYDSQHNAAILAWLDEFAPYGIVTTDREFRVQTWNRWMEAHSGKKIEAVRGQSLLTVFPDLGPRGLVARFTRALQGEVSVLSTALHRYLLPLESSVRERAFPQMQQTARIAPLRCGGEILGTVVIIEDVTEREAQANLLQRQNIRAKSLAWVLGQLLEAQEPRRTVRDLFCKVAEQFDLDAYFLYLCEPGGTTMKLQAVGGIAPELQEKYSQLEPDSPLGKLLLNMTEPLGLEHLGANGSDHGLWHSLFGFSACALLPLAVGSQQPLGFLGFATRTRESLQEGEMDLVSTIGQYLAIALEKETTNQQLRAAQAALGEQAQTLEQQVKERTATLREMVAESQTFTHTVAHDLRAPIRALSGYCLVLEEDFANALPVDAKAVIDRLKHACSQLDDLTRDLLDFAKISHERIDLAPVEVEALVHEQLALIRTNPATVEVRPPFHRVMAQRTLLRQCVSNLIENALKFVEPGKAPHVRVFTELVSGQASPGDSAAGISLGPEAAAPVSPSRKVRIIVEDTGIGIAAEAQEKIFGMFERGVTTSLYPGSGIGLAVVARAMQRMGGRCGVESKLGSGSRFWLELPEA